MNSQPQYIDSVDSMEIRIRTVNDVYDQARSVLTEIARENLKIEKHFPKLLASRLQSVGYFVTHNTKDILKDFNIPMDLIAWRKAYAQAVAIMVDYDLTDERIVELDNFRPSLLFPRNPLIKLMLKPASAGRMIIPPYEDASIIVPLLGERDPLTFEKLEQQTSSTESLSYAIGEQPF